MRRRDLLKLAALALVPFPSDSGWPTRVLKEVHVEGFEMPTPEALRDAIASMEPYDPTQEIQGEWLEPGPRSALTQHGAGELIPDLGVSVSESEANRAYAELLGTHVDSLTRREKQEAFRQATFSALREAYV